ncbi:MAG: hypothetical protein JWR16_1295 [Nevskia sp.]|nr:hypothetical protein [Nevskia sp.]
MASKDKGAVEIAVSAKLLAVDKAESVPEVVAYAFSAEARLLGSVALDAKGAGVLQLPRSPNAASVRVLIGPKVEQKAVDFEELMRRGAQEQHLRIDAERLRHDLQITIYPPVWQCWLRSACFVRGTLLKREVSGGVNVDLPVCNATVEVYEVDPWPIIIYKLPDDILQRLRDIILRPIPIPDPVGPVIGPVIGPVPGPDPVPFARTALARVGANTHRFDADTVASLNQLTETSGLRYAAQFGAKQQFQQALIDNALIVRPLFCLFWPWWVTMRLIATTQTDGCGHFQALFFQGCNNHDQPDLYFKAKQKLFGFFEVTIYAPTPISCHTWWNYVCGTEVTLYTTSPLAVTCPPCHPVIGPNNWVLWTALGNTSLKAIYGGGAAAASTANLGLLSSGAPWGGTLRPRLDFDNSLRDTLGVHYYQLSWRRGTAGGWTPLNAEVYRHYAHVVGSDLVIDPYKLGPHHMVVGGQPLELYELPPALPPIGQWTVANAVTDTENGEFDSVLHASGLSFDGNGAASGTDNSGLYQLKLELFDASGNLIDIASKGIVYVVPDTTDLTGTIHTVHADTVLQPGGGSLVVGNAMVLTLHIDNNHTWAGLGAPITPTGAADACCGVVPYAASDSVSLPYTVYHPHGYATYGLGVYRSATQILSFNGGTGNYTDVETVANMMSLNLPAACVGKPPCTLAAFSEHLDVYAMATDGWGSYLGYNSTADRAFALSPA